MSHAKWRVLRNKRPFLSIFRDPNVICCVALPCKGGSSDEPHFPLEGSNRVVVPRRPWGIISYQLPIYPIFRNPDVIICFTVVESHSAHKPEFPCKFYHRMSFSPIPWRAFCSLHPINSVFRAPNISLISPGAIVPSAHEPQFILKHRARKRSSFLP